MPMPNRNVEGDYRYKFQGQEKDAETGKEAFELRLWDNRIGRWLTADPYEQYHSPYLGMGNNPINGVDLDGGIWKPNYITLFGTTIDLTAIKIASINNLIDSQVSSLNNTNTSSMSLNQKNDLRLRLSYLKEAKSRIKKMGDDTNTTFELTAFGSSDTEVTSPTGSNSVSIPYDVGSIDNTALTIHEMMHGYQSINGVYNIKSVGSAFSFSSTKGKYQPETTAYKFQYAYAPSSLPSKQRVDISLFGHTSSVVFDKSVTEMSQIDNNYVMRLVNSVGNFVYSNIFGRGVKANSQGGSRIKSPRYF